MIALWWAGCVAEYALVLDQQSETPVPVVLGEVVEMPAGIVVTALARPFREDGELPSDTPVELATSDPDVLTLAPAATGTSSGAPLWALVAVGEGTTDLFPTVDGHEAAPIPVTIGAP